MSSPFVSLSRAILLGFLRDRAAVFFAIVFPLMFLVLFGGIFNESSSPKVDLIEVGSVPLLDHLPAGAKGAFDQAFSVTPRWVLDAALAMVR
jgi:ABC-2 type transport system permease protein